MSSTSANKDHYYATSIAKSRRGSPGDPQGIFQSGQGGRTVLPPFSAAFPNSHFSGSYPNAFTAPRSSPGRYDLANALSNFNTSPQWNHANPNPFPNYDMTTTPDRYASQHTYAYSRQTPPLSPSEQRRLPPLTTSSSPGGDRWQQSAFGVPAMHGYPASTTANGIRAPTASYTPAYYPTSQDDTYAYMAHDPLSPLGSHTTPSPYDEHLNNPLRLQPRPTSPYGRSVHTTSNLSGPHYNTPPPVSPTSPEEPTIKKKRKRADAHQLKVLNETYARTAFPSTEERHALAKALDMSARSVQIWFQNKRQSMRQTNRQSNNAASSSHQTYTHGSSQSERLIEESMSHGHGHPHSSNFPPSQITLTEATYLQGPGQDIPRPLISQSSSSHRRYRSPEEADSRFRNY